MPTVEEAKKMLCPYVRASICSRIELYVDIKTQNEAAKLREVINCQADQCPKWQWDDCDWQTCGHAKSVQNCKDCKHMTGYCG